MPSKSIYTIVFNEEKKNYEIQVTDEFGSIKSEYKFEPTATIEAAHDLMDDLKRKSLEENKHREFRSIVYVSPDKFEIINHRD